MALGNLQSCERNSLTRAHGPLMQMSGHPKDSFPQSGPKGPSDDICQKRAGQANSASHSGNFHAYG